MWVDGVAIQARILPAEEARESITKLCASSVTRRCWNTSTAAAIQANVFPIPPGDSRRIEISYNQVLEVDNGLIHYVYPMHSSANTGRRIEEMTISVNVQQQ